MLELLLLKLEPITCVENVYIEDGSEFSVNISDDESLEYEVVMKQRKGRERYEVKCLYKDAPYDHIILICPNFEPIVLANLNFSYWGDAYKISETAQFFFDKDVTLSVETFFGDFRGINLIDYEKEDFPSSFYALRAERIRCSDAVLSQFLQNGSRIDAKKPVTEDSD